MIGRRADDARQRHRSRRADRSGVEQIVPADAARAVQHVPGVKARARYAQRDGGGVKSIARRRAAGRAEHRLDVRADHQPRDKHRRIHAGVLVAAARMLNRAVGEHRQRQ